MICSLFDVILKQLKGGVTFLDHPVYWHEVNSGSRTDQIIAVLCAAVTWRTLSVCPTDHTCMTFLLLHRYIIWLIGWRSRTGKLMISGDKSGEFGISSRAPCKDCLHIQSILRHGGLLREIIEDRMKGKPTRGKRRIQMQNNLANDGGFVALKRATAWGQRGVETQRKDVKTCCTAEDCCCCCCWWWCMVSQLVSC